MIVSFTECRCLADNKEILYNINKDWLLEEQLSKQDPHTYIYISLDKSLLV